MNVFDPAPIEYPVGDFTLVLKPLPFKPLQRALAVVTAALKDLDAGRGLPAAELLAAVPGTMATRFAELAGILFPQEFVTPDWVADHVTLPMARRILQDAVEQNQVADFFADLRGRPTPGKTPEPVTIAK